MKPIEPGRADRPRIDTEDLKTLARLISGRLHLQCPQCKDWRKLTVEMRELRIGSSPDLSAIDARHPAYPRLVFLCSRCRRTLGFVQGEEWSPADAGEAEDAPTRWDRLEIDPDVG